MRSLRSKAPLLLALAALVVTMRAALRQRRILRALGATFLGYAGEDGVNAVFGFFSGVADEVKSLIRQALAAALTPVWDLFQGIEEFLTGLRDFVQNIYDTVTYLRNVLFENLRNALTWLVQGARDFASTLAADAVAYLIGIVSTVRDYILGIVSDIRDALWAGITAARDFVLSVVSTVRDDIIAIVSGVRDVLQAAIGGAVDYVVGIVSTVRDDIIAIVSGVRDALWAGITAARDFATSILSGALDFAKSAFDDVWGFIYKDIVSPLEAIGEYVWKTAQPLLDVITEVLDWLVWLAELPFTAAHDIFDALRSLTPRAVLDAMQDASDRTKGAVLKPLNGGKF